MKTVVDYLVNSKVQYFATVGTDQKPKVRPFQFMLEDGGKLYFCTGTAKPVYREMQQNPNVEICSCGENYSWLRLSGTVRFSDDLGMKSKIMNSNALVKSIYQTPDNPGYAIFYLENAQATITDFSGNPPQIFKL